MYTDDCEKGSLTLLILSKLRDYSISEEMAGFIRQYQSLADATACHPGRLHHREIRLHSAEPAFKSDGVR